MSREYQDPVRLRLREREAASVVRGSGKEEGEVDRQEGDDEEDAVRDGHSSFDQVRLRGRRGLRAALTSETTEYERSDVLFGTWRDY